MVGFQLLNQWKGATQSNFLALADYLAKEEKDHIADSENLTVLDIIRHHELRELVIQES